ncbi:homocysteine S-methyltransferase family protein [Nisaea acidiphila]|uniref:Homocysteine S-methyltransferase family protein n=1 Tax=Nisaea acidiphila TaxID=1862145 RepID=A0A9J7ASS1_9PROT|nr:homocysteine S-methyltransferase family protein [Nisaea acidiphila]UUX48405.1 homocysteine S-methyltransferase family protein [Nisaea acidiphila]
MIGSGERVPHAAPAPAGQLARWVGQNGCVEALNIERPKLVMKVHRRFVKAGAEIIFTNSGNAAPQLLRNFRMFDEAFAVSFLGAELARTVANEATHRVHVIGDVRLPSRVPVTGFMTEEELGSAARCLVSAQVAGGADAVLMDVPARPNQLVAALNGARWGMTEARRKVPLMLLMRPAVLPGRVDPGRLHDELAEAATVAATAGIAALGVNPGDIPETTPELLEHVLPYWGGSIALSPAADAATVRTLCEDPMLGGRLAFLPSSSPRDLRRVIKTNLGTAAAVIQRRNRT